MKFLLTVLSIWAAMHLYVFARVWVYCGVRAAYALAILPVYLLLMLSPIAGLVLDRMGHPSLGKSLAVPGVVWGGVFFLFFSVSVVHDAYNALATVASLGYPPVSHARLMGVRPILAEGVLVCVLSVYSFLEAAHIRTEHVRVPVPGLPADLDGLRIAQITDVHIGISVGRRRLAHHVAEKTGPFLHALLFRGE